MTLYASRLWILPKITNAVSINNPFIVITLWCFFKSKWASNKTIKSQNRFSLDFHVFKYFPKLLLFLLLSSPATIIYCGRDVFLSSGFQQLPASSTKHLKHIFFEAQVEPLTKHTEIKMSEEKILLVFVANAFFKFTSFRKSFLRAQCMGNTLRQ